MNVYQICPNLLQDKQSS